MATAPDISVYSLFLCSVLVLIPLIIGILFRLKIIKSIFVAVIRMSVQLFLAGLYLKYLFEWNIPALNLLWLVLMVLVASISSVKNSSLSVKLFLLPSFLSFLIATFLIVFYLNQFVIRLDNLFEAKYLVVIGGMLLGNSMRGNIIGVSNFYSSIKRNEKRYLYHLALGATQYENLKQYIRHALLAALNPTLATMMTIGIVSLPGMMTGQMLGGSDPMVAIKYQIVIMIAIFVSVSFSVLLIILFTIRIGFDNFGLLKGSVFSSVKK